jgi:hypothetical protein
MQNDEGRMYIMRGYTDNMKGKKIPDNMVVKPFTSIDGEDWAMKSTDRCPRYAVCKACASSGPAGMHGEKKWIDAEWISRMCEMTHLEAGAHRTQTYPFQTTPTIQVTE